MAKGLLTSSKKKIFLFFTVIVIYFVSYLPFWLCFAPLLLTCPSSASRLAEDDLLSVTQNFHTPKLIENVFVKQISMQMAQSNVLNVSRPTISRILNKYGLKYCTQKRIIILSAKQSKAWVCKKFLFINYSIRSKINHEEDKKEEYCLF